MPLHVFGGRHSGGAEEISREADGCGVQAGTIELEWFVVDGGLEVANGVWEGDVDVGGAAEEVEGVKESRGLGADSACRAGDGDGCVEDDVSVLKGVGEGDGVGVDGRDDVGSWA